MPDDESLLSSGDTSGEAIDAAAAKAAREEAIRALLDAPTTDEPSAPRSMPAPEPRSGPIALAPDVSLPLPEPAVRTNAGYSFLEVALGFLVTVLIAVAAIMGGAEMRARNRAARAADELRTLAAAFEQYRSVTHDWPASATAAGALPPGMEKFLANDVWTRPTPLDGHYTWLKPAGGNPPAIGITAFVPDSPLSLSRRGLERIDRLLDDGVLSTGRFRSGFNGWPVYFLSDPR
jgi:hypothetical protein